MFPGLESLLGGLLGGAFRLGQAFLDAREKQRERDHEHRMTELQGQLAERAGERRLREVGLEGEIRLGAAEIEAMVAATRAQSEEARAAGGWVSALSATVRPLVTYLLVLLYLAWKGAQVMAAFQTGGAVEALRASYGEADMAVLSSILAFWFVDRSLRRGRSPLGA